MTREEIKHDWSVDEVMALFEAPLNDLLFQAQSIHRRYHTPNEVQISTLFGIKTGGCPEDCKFCPQSIHYDTGLDLHNLLGVDDVVEAARKARAAGATRFCMGAGWRGPTHIQVRRVCELIEAVADLEMEPWVTLGMLTHKKAEDLARAGLDYYNHNLDTSPEYYGEVITTRTYQDRLDTLANVRAAGIRVCCGGIVGMGESRKDRASLLVQLANLPEHPESVPINNLVRVAGTPMQDAEVLSPLELARCVAVARILMPRAVVRAWRRAAGPSARRPRRSASWQERARSSAATRHSPCPIRASAPTRRCSRIWGLPPRPSSRPVGRRTGASDC